MIVAFLGPDGSGKSSVISGVTEAVGVSFSSVNHFHLRPRLGARGGEAVVVTSPHGKKPYGPLLSLLKLVYLAADYIVGYYRTIRPISHRGGLIIFDRYYHDLLVDPLRFRYGGPKWLARAFGRMIPQPDLWVLLDASPEVLQGRKQEVSFEETKRQREAYIELTAGLSSASVVDASLPLDQVVDRVVQLIEKRRGQV